MVIAGLLLTLLAAPEASAHLQCPPPNDVALAGLNGGPCLYDLETAIGLAQFSDTVFVRGGAYVVPELVIDTAIRVVGSDCTCSGPVPGPEPPTRLEAEPLNRVMTITADDVLIEKLELADGHALDGGLLRIVDPLVPNGMVFPRLVTIRNVRLENGVADNEGGCIWAGELSTALDLDGARFVGCQAAARGGGVHFGGQSLRVIDAEVRGVAPRGGALHVVAGEVSVTATSSVDGFADLLGGALYVESASVTVRGTAFGVSADRGGAVHLDGADLMLLADGRINGTAPTGGGIHAVASTIELRERATLRGTATQGDGGAVHLSAGSTLALTEPDNVVGLGSSAVGGRGGCVFATSSMVSATGGSHFEDCTADGDGGCIFAADTTVDITDDSSVQTCTAGGDGGAIAATAASSVTFSQSVPPVSPVPVITGAHAGGHGGAVSLTNLSSLRVSDSRISLSDAGSDGGCLRAVTADVMLRDAVLARCDAANGGGVDVVAGQLAMVDSVLFGNAASLDGGGLRAVDTAMTLTGLVIVSHNMATLSGGGVRVIGGTVDAAGTWQILDNHAGETIGGLGLVDGADATVAHLVVTDNSAVVSGGGLGLRSGASLVLTGPDNEIGRNDGGGRAGGAGVFSASFVVPGAVDIHENDAATGAGVYAGAGTLLLQGASSIRNNVATGDGGGLYVDHDAVVRLRDGVELSANTAARGGGAFVRPGLGPIPVAPSLELRGAVLVEGNIADVGGGIFATGVAAADPTAPSVVFVGDPWDLAENQVQPVDGALFVRGNEASSGGAGVAVEDANVQAQFVVFSTNEVDGAGEGGGLRMDGSSSHVELLNSLVLDNIAGEGGGVAVLDGEFRMASDFTSCIPEVPTPLDRSWEDRYCSEIRENEATGGDGGGLIAEGHPRMRIRTTAIFENQADNGTAALHLRHTMPGGAAPQLRLFSTLFADNVADGTGEVVVVGGRSNLLAGFNTFADPLAVVYGPDARGRFVGNIVWGGAPGLGQLDIQRPQGLNGRCNLGNLWVPGSPTLSTNPSHNNDNQVDPQFVGPNVNPRGRFHIDAVLSPNSVDECNNDGRVDLDGNPRPIAIATGPARFDRGAIEAVP